VTDSPIEILRWLATGIVIAATVYAYVLILVGHRVQRPTATSVPLYFVILVPCLNEEGVIGRTITSLLSLRGRFHIVALDDASDDGSRDVIREFPAHMVTLIERQGSDSRVGKGAALNRGFSEVLDWDVERLFGAENVIVAVFDSDSRVPQDFLERVSPYFTDPATVGVQSAVRMYNADANRLAYWQHLEFLVWGQIFSRAKDRLGSATLGGNGQCVRLSSLKNLGSAPWRPSLTEDLDLSLRLVADGGRIRFCGDTYVEQEAVTRFTQLIRQRGRWVQGHLVAWDLLGRVLRGRAPLPVRLDIAMFLLLPASLVPLALGLIDGWLVFLSSLSDVSFGGLAWWYALAFASVPVTLTALARAQGASRLGHLVVAHQFVLYGLFWMIAAGRGAASIIRGDRSWAKTSRVLDSSPAAPVDAHGTHAPTWARQALFGAALIAVIGMSSLLLAFAATLTAATYADVIARGPSEATSDATSSVPRGP
jgi:cellulose synthase/poly-beta-1,6-N-acetylglucosamine synthase-like glycosyltransferase